MAFSACLDSQLLGKLFSQFRGETQLRQSSPKPSGKERRWKLVRGTEESDRIAALASAQTEVRARAVLPGRGSAEHQATGAFPQPTDNTYYGTRRLAEVEWKTGLQRYREGSFPSRTFSTPTPDSSTYPIRFPETGEVQCRYISPGSDVQWPVEIGNREVSR